MGARGKRSAADLAVVTVIGSERPAPWPALTEAEATYWRNVVDSLPADWFRPSDLPQLAAYCKAAAQQDAAHARLADEDAVEMNAAGTRVPNPNFRIIAACTQQMAQLAGKLRLCPSARYDEKKAARAGKDAPAAKPWEFGKAGR